MSRYTELQSEYDRLPDSLSESLMVTKRDVQWELDYRLNTLYEFAGEDSWHSIKYYTLLKDMIRNFKRKLELTVLPKHLEDWWRYTYELSHKGVRLYVEHINTVWLNEETGELDEETVDQVFPLISYDARMLTVDEYAKLYDVEPVTVRQWIRRGKLREAEKVGKEWRISELTDVPGRARYEPATYKWISRLKGIPEEFAFLSDYTNIDIRKRELNVTEADPEITFIAFLSSRAERGDGVAVRLTDAAKDRLEAYLIANPDVLFTGNTRTYAYKHEETIDEEGDENE